MWQDVHESDDDQDADLGAQLRSPDYASPQSSGVERVERDSSPPFQRCLQRCERFGILYPSRRCPSHFAQFFWSHWLALTDEGEDKFPSPRQRHIISREQLAELSFDLPPGSDFSKPHEETDLDPNAPLLQPPAVILNASHGSRKSLLASECSTIPGKDSESAEFYTAQCVRVGQSTSSSGVRIINILRQSWLSAKPRSATRTTSSPFLVGKQLTDNELEAGRILNSQLRSEMGYRHGARPSSASTRSGNTVFYDAQSCEDMSSTPSPIPPPPQATTSTGHSGHAGPSPLFAEPLHASDEGEVLPECDPSPTGRSQARRCDWLSGCANPITCLTFALASGERLPPPPGLGVSEPSPVAAPSSDFGVTINIELLEEEPPAAGESWRQIAQD